MLIARLLDGSQDLCEGTMKFWLRKSRNFLLCEDHRDMVLPVEPPTHIALELYELSCAELFVRAFFHSFQELHFAVSVTSRARQVGL